MELLKFNITKFELTEYGHYEGMVEPTHPAFKGKNKITLNVDNCTITSVRMLYRIIADQLNIESKIIEEIEKEGKSDVHQLQYSVKEFLENILAEMKKVEGIDDLGYYVITSRML